jgi:hypothetical protein
MEKEAEPDSIDQKNYFLKRQDMAFRLIYMYVFIEIQLLLHVESFSTPEKVWTKLEFIFRIKEDCEECMQEIDKTNLA